MWRQTAPIRFGWGEYSLSLSLLFLFLSLSLFLSFVPFSLCTSFSPDIFLLYLPCLYFICLFSSSSLCFLSLKAPRDAVSWDKERERGREKKNGLLFVKLPQRPSELKEIISWATNCYYKYHIAPNWYQFNSSFFGFAIQDLRSHRKNVCVGSRRMAHTVQNETPWNTTVWLQYICEHSCSSVIYLLFSSAHILQTVLASQLSCNLQKTADEKPFSSLMFLTDTAILIVKCNIWKDNISSSGIMD